MSHKRLMLGIGSICFVFLLVFVGSLAVAQTSSSGQTWYVRPPGQSYGTGNGTSYANAWTSLEKVSFGPSGVNAGDTLYVCGTHTASGTKIISIPSGTATARITIRMDCPGGDNGKVSRYIFDLGRSSYLTFYQCYLDNVPIIMDKPGDPGSGSLSHDVTIDSCVLKNYEEGIIDLYAGQDNWVIRNSDLSQAATGIYTHTPGHANNLTVENNSIHDLCLKQSQLNDSDCHAIGIQNGSGHIIQNNKIWNTGEAISLWSGNYDMKNILIRNNFIKDVKAVCKTDGHGIAISGDPSTTVLGRRTGIKVIGNIIINTGIGSLWKNCPSPMNVDGNWKGDGIHSNNLDPVVIDNNVIVNTRGFGIRLRPSLGGTSYPAQGTIRNNIFYQTQGGLIGVSGSTPGNLAIDYNLYYPASGKNDQTFSLSQFTSRDTHSIFADPKFVSANPQGAEDVKLRADSPAIDRGANVGLTTDFSGNAIPNGTIPDIGAYEYGVAQTVTSPINSTLTSVTVPIRTYHPGSLAPITWQSTGLSQVMIIWAKLDDTGTYTTVGWVTRPEITRRAGHQIAITPNMANTFSWAIPPNIKPGAYQVKVFNYGPNDLGVAGTYATNPYNSSNIFQIQNP